MIPRASTGLLATLLFAASLPLGADQPRRFTLREQTLSADRILHGKVISGHSRVEHGRIYTYYEVSGLSALKGGGGNGRTVVRTPGGVVGLVAYVVPEAPEFLEREEVVLFLRTLGEGVFELDGLAAAVYRVGAGPDGLPEARPNVEPEGAVLSAEGHVFPQGRPLPLDAFLRAVSGYLGGSYSAPVRVLPPEYYSPGEKGVKRKTAAAGPELSAGNVQAGYSRILDRPLDIFWDLSRDYGPVRGGSVHWSFNPDSIAGKSPYGVTPEQALEAAEWSFEQWNEVSTARIRFEFEGQRRDIPDHKLDLVNVVTFADSEYTHGIQKDAIASARPFVLTRRTWVGPEGLDWDLDGRIDFPDFPEGIWEAGTILDCDIRWDVGGPYAAVDFTVDKTPGALSMQAVFIHEVGHMAGLVHSPIRDLGTLISGRNSTPTMFSIAFPNAADGSGNPMTSLEHDDVVSLSMLYPTADFSTVYGTIEGSVVKGSDGAPVRGNFVVAFSAGAAPYRSLIDGYHRAGTVVGTFSDRQGNFRIPGLPPGDYLLALQPMDDMIPGTNRNAFNTLVSRFGDKEFVWSKFYSGPREGVPGTDPLDYETLSVAAGEALTGIRIVTNFYPEGRIRLRRMFGERDYIVSANQLRLSAVSALDDMVARRFPQAFEPPYRVTSAACDFASITAPPEGAQVIWPEIMLAVSRPDDPSRPDLADPLAVIRDFRGDGTLISTDPLPFDYPLTVDRPGELWLVVRSPNGRFNAFHNIDILGAGQGELHVDESFVSFDAGRVFQSVMPYGISLRMGLELEGASALEPLAGPKLLKSEDTPDGGIRLHFAAPRSLSGLSPTRPVTLSLKYRHAAQPYPEASLLRDMVADPRDGSVGFNLTRPESRGDSSLYRLTGLRTDRNALAGRLVKLSGPGPEGGELSLQRVSGRMEAGMEGLWEGTLHSAGTVGMDLRGGVGCLQGVFIWPASNLPEADTSVVFRSLPGDTVLVVDSLPSNPAGFELRALDDSGRVSLPSVLGLGRDRFEPNERIQDARALFPSYHWPSLRHGLSAVRGIIASTKDRADFDFFRFPVRRGDSVVIDVDATSIRPFHPASVLDAFIEAFDSTGTRFTGIDGREVLNDDEHGLDPFHSFISPRDATLYLKLLEAGVFYGDPGGLTGHNMFYELRVSILPRRGDVVRDGIIRIDDALAAIDAARNPRQTDQQSLFAADFNGDGIVDMADAAAVFRLALDDPLARTGTNLAADEVPGGMSLSLWNGPGTASLCAESHGATPGLLWLEFTGGPVAPRAGTDLPPDARIHSRALDGTLCVILDMGQSRESFSVGEILSFDLSGGGKVELLRTAGGTPGAGEAWLAVASGLHAGAELPREYGLAGNHPNPFNPSTVIEYSVPVSAQGEVVLAVYDIRGRRVRALASGAHAPGQYRVVWDGTDRSGRVLPSGVYFCRMSAPGFSAVRKMVLLK